jgi:ribosomal protein S8
MSKELEKACSRLRECVRNNDDEYALEFIKQALEQKEQLEKELERYKETNNDIKDTITIYLELQGKIFSSLTNLNDIEYSNYHKSYKKLKKLVGGNDE